MLRFLSKCLSGNTLNELYKLYVMPHLDYGDVIYHIPQKEDNSSSLGNHLMEISHKPSSPLRFEF